VYSKKANYYIDNKPQLILALLLWNTVLL